jgi:SPP1 family predicted phage head-tail adaptor
MIYDQKLTLVKKSYSEDDIGNQISTLTETDVLCSVKSISKNEYYKAAQTDLWPSLIFVIHHFEYDGETEVIFDGKRYSVIRTYRQPPAYQTTKYVDPLSVDIDALELLCERRATNGSKN